MWTRAEQGALKRHVGLKLLELYMRHAMHSAERELRCSRLAHADEPLTRAGSWMHWTAVYTLSSS